MRFPSSQYVPHGLFPIVRDFRFRACTDRGEGRASIGPDHGELSPRLSLPRGAQSIGTMFHTFKSTSYMVERYSLSPEFNTFEATSYYSGGQDYNDQLRPSRRLPRESECSTSGIYHTQIRPVYVADWRPKPIRARLSVSIIDTSNSCIDQANHYISQIAITGGAFCQTERCAIQQ